MSAPPLKPATAAMLAAFIGFASGAGWFWYGASKVVDHAIHVRRQAAAAKAQKIQMQRSLGWDFWTVEMENLSSELTGEKTRLHEKAADLDQQAARLAAERKELDRVRQEVEAMRKEIDLRIVAIRGDEMKNLHTLAQTYTTLSPRAAVAIIRELDDSTTVKILSLMKPDVVGPIFEEMANNPGPDGSLARRAATLSDKIRLMRTTVLPPTASVGP